MNEIEKINVQIIDSEKNIKECNEELQMYNSNHQASITEYQNKISKLEEEINVFKGRNDYEEIVSLVFNNYEQSEWPSELIVRVPHMIVCYQNNTNRLDKLKMAYKDLFDYYNDVVMQKIDQTQSMLRQLFNNSYEIEFNSLTDAYKVKIHHSKVNFQGVEVKFNEIIEDKNSDVFHQLNSEQIHGFFIENKSLKIGYAQELKTTFYTDRDFIDFGIETNNIFDYYPKEVLKNLISFDQITSIADDKKMILLSDHAGAGKTTTFKHLSLKLKEKIPNFWISYIDLKRHLKVYEKFEQNYQNLEVLKEILSITDELEIEIFTQLFESNKVILLYDGVDEIAPKFKDFFIKLIESVRNSTTNQQWIATRPQHMQELRDKFNQITYKLVPYHRDKKMELIEKVLKNIEAENVDAEDILHRILNINVDSPLMLQMMTELYVNDKTFLQDSNLFSLYDKMIEMKKRILGVKGEIANEDRDNRKAKLSIWQIHQIYALKLLFKDGFYDRLNDKMIDINEFKLLKKWNKKEKSKWTPEAISRYGLLYVDYWNTDDEFPDFAHRTFAEFFVTQFAIQDLYELDEDDDDDNEMSKKEIELRFKLLIAMGNENFRDYILSFVDIHKSKIMHNNFFKLITLSEMQNEFISDSQLYRNTLIKIFSIDARFLKEFTLNGNLTFFQNSLTKHDLFDIQQIVKIYEISLGEDWIHHTGFSVKQNYTMPNFDKYTGILSLIDQLEIPQNHLLKFFGNNFYKICEKTVRNSGWIQNVMKFIQNNFNNGKNELIKMIMKIIRYDHNQCNRIIKNAKEFFTKLEEFLRSDKEISVDDINDFFTKLNLYSCGMKNIIKTYEEEKLTKNQIQQIFIKHSVEIINDIYRYDSEVSVEDFIIFFKEIFNVQSERDQLKKFLEMRCEYKEYDLKNDTVLSYLNERIYFEEKKEKFELLQRTVLDLAKQIEITDDEI